MTNFAYLRVSTNTQDVANQKLWLLEYANKHGYVPIQIVEETASRKVPWKDRLIGDLILKRAQKGDAILSPEFTRLGGSPGQVFTMLEKAAERGITIIITKQNIVMDGSLNSQLQAVVFSMAAMIDIEFTRERTKEGLQRARLEGRIGGRKKGSVGRLKLDPHLERIREIAELGLSVRKLSQHFQVTEKTMAKFIKRHNLRNKVAS